MTQGSRNPANDRTRKWRKKNPEKLAAQKARWYQRHKDDVLARTNRLKRTEAWRSNLRQISRAERPKTCEACNQERNTVYDHCHQSGEFRGWLCHQCNCALGLVKDNPATLRALANYLEKGAPIPAEIALGATRIAVTGGTSLGRLR